MDFHFDIVQWRFISSAIIHNDDWHKEEFFTTKPRESYQSDLHFLPALKRRRLKGATRLLIESLWDIHPNIASLPIIYASRNGESTRNIATWRDLLCEQSLSPTQFSLSVHNAVLGQISELFQSHHENHAIASYDANLEIAITEAYAQFQEGVKEILVIVMEEEIPKTYPLKPLKQAPFSYALTLLLRPGKNYQLRLNHGETAPTYDSALRFVRAQKLKEKTWHSSYQRKSYWQWSRA